VDGVKIYPNDSYINQKNKKQKTINHMIEAKKMEMQTI
jgi:hypothetical protein